MEVELGTAGRLFLALKARIERQQHRSSDRAIPRALLCGGRTKAHHEIVLPTPETPGATLEASFPGIARRSAATPTFADLAAPAKTILPEIEWRKRPVRKGATPDAGHRRTLSRWTVIKPAKPLEKEANYTHDSHLNTFPLVSTSPEFFFPGMHVISGKSQM